MTLFHRYNRKKVVGGEEKERLTSGVQSEPTSRGSLAMTVRQPDDVANYKKESIAATKHYGYTPMQQSLAVKKGERDGAAVAAAAADMARTVAHWHSVLARLWLTERSTLGGRGVREEGAPH